MALASAESGKPYRITRAELELLRKKNLPIPELHPDERHLARMQRRNPPQLWERVCGESGQPIITSYAPERPDIVLCEEAYLKSLL